MADSSNPYSVGPSVDYAAPLLNFMGPANAIQNRQRQQQQQPGPNAQPGAPLSLAPPNPGGAQGMPQPGGPQGQPAGLAQVLQRMFGGGQPQPQPGYAPNGPAPVERVDINGRPIAGPNAATGIY